MDAVILIVGAVVVGVLALLVWKVDDWRRDLTQNYAATSEQASERGLRPIHTPTPPEQVAPLVVSVAQELPRWRLAEVAREASRINYHFVRTTPLLRFQDDIYLHLAPQGVGTRITAESRSRIGRGDLGQNPRNLAEILDPLRERLDQ